MYNQLNSPVWETPLANMEEDDGRLIIPEVPILATGQWKGTLIAERNLEEVCEWQKEHGPVHLVQDHIEDVNDFVGLADNFRISEDPRGFKVIVADLEVVDDQLAKKLKLMKEKGGGFAGISPRIDWSDRDPDGNVEGLTAPHVAIVIHPAQGKITGLSEELEMADQQPNTCKCPKCGATMKKERGVPCSTVDCPECGTKMIGVRLEEEAMSKKDKNKFEADDLKMIKCPKCGTTNPEGSEKCRKCGTKLSVEAAETKKCPECGAEVPTDAEKCPECGAELKCETPPEKEKEKMGEDESWTIPANMIAEMQQIAKNEKADAPAMRGFIQRMAEQMQKKEKPEEEEEVEEKDKEKKPEDEYPYPKKKKMSYAFPTKPDVETLEVNKYRKELLPQGLFMHPAGVGLLPISDEFISTLKSNTEKVFGEKQIPITIGHPKGEITPDKTVGWLGSLEQDMSLFGCLEITNSLVKDSIDDTTLRDCSLGINLEYLDEHGKVVGPVITHLALTNLPYFKKLEGFSKLAASEDVHVDELTPVENTAIVDKETVEKVSEMHAQLESISEKYAAILKKVVDARQETCLTELDGLVEAELVRPGAKERFSEFIQKTADKEYDEKRSVAEVFVDLLKTGLLKADVTLSHRVSVQGDELRELVTSQDFKDFPINTMIRNGKISHDQKTGKPFWVNGRPTQS